MIVLEKIEKTFQYNLWYPPVPTLFYWIQQIGPSLKLQALPMQPKKVDISSYGNVTYPIIQSLANLAMKMCQILRWKVEDVTNPTIGMWQILRWRRDKSGHVNGANPALARTITWQWSVIPAQVSLTPRHGKHRQLYQLLYFIWVT